METALKKGINAGLYKSRKMMDPAEAAMIRVRCRLRIPSKHEFFIYSLTLKS
jgi:hypothetical protein